MAFVTIHEVLLPWLAATSTIAAFTPGSITILILTRLGLAGASMLMFCADPRQPAILYSEENRIHL
jgi:hypothetical protein